jgi:hypothetical protein
VEEPPARRPAAYCLSGDDAPVLARFRRIRGQRFVSVEVQVALDGNSEWPAQFANLAHADEAQFRASHAEICEAEGDVVEPELGEEPVHCASGVKSLTTGVKSISSCWLSMRTICAGQLAMSCSVCDWVKSVMLRFLVLADRSGPFTKPKDRGGPRRNRATLTNSRLQPQR